MGSGKSTVGRHLAKKLNRPLYDSDALIEEREKMTVDLIFEKKGEAAFREIEKKVIAELSQKKEAVISTGGGVPCFEENWNHFEESFVVWLKSSPQKIFERLKKGTSAVRPLLKNNLTVEKITQILSEREKFYQRASLVVDIDGLTPEQSTEKIAEEFKKIA